MVDVIQQFTDDSGYWVELGQDGPKTAEVRLYLAKRKDASVLAFLLFAGEAREWVGAHLGEVVRAQVGGAAGSVVRLLPDPKGTLKRYDNRGVAGICLRHVSRWPQEKRAPVPCTWMVETSSGGMIVTLPAGFVGQAAAVPLAPRFEMLPDEEPEPEPKTPDQIAMGRLKETVAAAAGPVLQKVPDPIVAASRKQIAAAPEPKAVQRHAAPEPATDRRSANRAPSLASPPVRGKPVELPGLPPPGRSALDQRKAEVGNG